MQTHIILSIFTYVQLIKYLNKANLKSWLILQKSDATCLFMFNNSNQQNASNRQLGIHIYFAVCYLFFVVFYGSTHQQCISQTLNYTIVEPYLL